MRTILGGVVLGALLVAVAGCNVLSPRPGGGGGGGPALTDNGVPTADKLVAYLNANADRVPAGQAVASQNVMIDVKAEVDGRTRQFSVDSKLMCQAPRNLRMTGVLLSQPAVDIGSNRDEFWYWIGKNDPPYLVHCSYEALARGTRVPFPFQPDMAITAMGLGKYDPSHKYDLKVVDNKRGYKVFELSEETVSPQGQKIQKVVVFDARAVSPPSPQVLGHILKDAQGNVICSASIRRAQPVGGAVIPREVTFSWPQMKMQMTMRIENPQLVPMTEERAADVFTRRNLRYQSFDLATGTLDGAGVQRAGATSPYPSR